MGARSHTSSLERVLQGLSRYALLGLLSLLAMITAGPAMAEEVPDRDVELSLPSELSFEIREDGRSVIVSGSAGRLEVRAPEGKVEVKRVETLPLAIRSSAGAVVIEAGRSALPIDVQTRTGSITLLVSGESSLEIELATSGEITVDFSIDLDYRYHEEPAKWGRMVLGSGRIHVNLRSRRGTIRVLQGVG